MSAPRPTAAERQKRFYFYGQDTWRATSKLTVAFGLRWDIINPEYVNADGNGSLLDLNTGLLRVGGVGDIDRNFNIDKNWKNFGPRLGIAYQLTPKTVVRMGYGRSYDIGVFGSIFGHAVTQNLPVLAVQNLNPQFSNRCCLQSVRRADGAGLPLGAIERPAASA